MARSIKLVEKVKRCKLCKDLPLGPKPILQASKSARILIAGQAPGAKTHDKGIPFDDASGERLRQWLEIDRACFYDASKIAVLPMAFCYPGRGKSGDLPPPSICAETWRHDLLNQLSNIELTLVIGQYAMAWHLPASKEKMNLTEIVMSWEDYAPAIFPLPHPSPRNNIWLKKNPWFEKELLPQLQHRVRTVLGE